MVPEDQAVRVALEDPAVRVDPVVVQAARADPEGQAEPVVPEDPAVRVDPAGIGDSAVSACGLPGINN